MNTITITIPIPPAILSPNSRGHWSKRCAPRAGARFDAQMATIHALDRRPAPRWRAAKVVVHWFAKQPARRDPDNFLARLKATFDGIRDAGLIADDNNLLHTSPVFTVDKSDPRVEITISLLDV